MSVHDTHLSTMTAAWLLPVVPTIVASATGSIVAGVLPNAQHALWTLITSYVLWGMGVSLALFTLVIYFQRLTLHRLPPREVIVSVFLPLGPLGQGGFAVLQMGKVALEILPSMGTISPNAGEILYVLGFMIALVMWGFGLVWLFFALASIYRSKFPFNMGVFSSAAFIMDDLLTVEGWWGFTFPIGVYASSTISIGKEMPSAFFGVVGSVSRCVSQVRIRFTDSTPRYCLLSS